MPSKKINLPNWRHSPVNSSSKPEKGTVGVEGVLTPSMLAEASIHVRPLQKESPRFLARKGNPSIEVPPLYYNPSEHTGWIYFMANKPNGVIYVGQTTNLLQRTFQHKEGKIEGFSKRYGCKTLVYFEGYQLITESIAREDAMKYWQRAWKVKRILQTNPTWRDLYPDVCNAHS